MLQFGLLVLRTKNISQKSIRTNRQKLINFLLYANEDLLMFMYLSYYKVVWKGSNQEKCYSLVICYLLQILLHEQF